MHGAGLIGVHRRSGHRGLTRQSRAASAPPDLIERDFTAEVPNQKWTADIPTCPPSRGGSTSPWSWTCSRDALAMVMSVRRPYPGLVHHLDKGSHYTSLAFGRRCDEVGISPSTGRSGPCFDNAVTENFFASLETELIDRTDFATHAEAEQEMFSDIEGFYNPWRRHSANGHINPAEYGRRHTEAIIQRPKATPEIA